MNGNTWVGGHKVYEPCIILKPERVHIARTARIDSFCKIEGGDGVEIGDNVHIASFTHINVGGGITIFEAHSGCSSHCCIGSATPDWSNLFASAAEPRELHNTQKFKTVIKEYAILFMGVIVLPGVTIGKGAIVRPGSVVADDVEDWCIVQGNPARVVGERKLYERSSGLLVPQRSPLSGEVHGADGWVPESSPRAGR